MFHKDFYRDKPHEKVQIITIRAVGQMEVARQRIGRRIQLAAAPINAHRDADKNNSNTRAGEHIERRVKPNGGANHNQGQRHTEPGGG